MRQEKLRVQHMQTLMTKPRARPQLTLKKKRRWTSKFQMLLVWLHHNQQRKALWLLRSPGAWRLVLGAWCLVLLDASASALHAVLRTLGSCALWWVSSALGPRSASAKLQASLD